MMSFIIYSILECIKETIKILSTSWQLIILIIIFVFRKELTDLINTCTFKIKYITKFKYKDFFAEATIQETIEKYPAKNDEQKELNLTPDKELLIVYDKFEKYLRAKIDIDTKSMNLAKILKTAVNQNVITNDEKEVIYTVLLYRNFILHNHCNSKDYVTIYSLTSFLKSMIVKLDGGKNDL